MSYHLKKLVPIARGLMKSNKSGQKEIKVKPTILQVEAKYSLGFVNDETGEFHITTDLTIKKSRKKRRFMEYYNVYNPFFKTKQVSILLFVLDNETKVSDFLSFIKKKIKRIASITLGYIWTNDIGDEEGKLHTHIMISTNRLSSEQIDKLIKSKKIKIVLCNNLNAFNKYLLKKELYASYKKKSWGSSRKFKSPKK